MERDLKVYRLTKLSFYNYWWMDVVRFQCRLRKIEYLHNVRNRNIFCNIYRFMLEVMNHRLAIRWGFSIPKNVFGAGLCIVHYGTLVVSRQSQIGENCRIHPSTSIG